MNNILSAIGIGLLAGKVYHHVWAPTQPLVACAIIIATAVGSYLLMRTQSEES